MNFMEIKKVFLYGELQISVPFSEVDWRNANAMLKSVPGLISKTWLSGVNTQTVGGFYEFDSINNARAYATGPYVELARSLGASLTVKLFNGDVVEDASRGISSPHYV